MKEQMNRMNDGINKKQWMDRMKEQRADRMNE